ncbi:hypothetical protein MBANPS3_012041 [Mucor bainieri]
MKEDQQTQLQSEDITPLNSIDDHHYSHDIYATQKSGIMGVSAIWVDEDDQDNVLDASDNWFWEEAKKSEQGDKTEQSSNEFCDAQETLSEAESMMTAPSITGKDAYQLAQEEGKEAQAKDTSKLGAIEEA